MRKSFLKGKDKDRDTPLLPIGKEPRSFSGNTPTGSGVNPAIVFSILLSCVLGGLLIWNIVETQQLLRTTTTTTTGAPTTTPIPFNSYTPVIFRVLSSNSVSLQGSTINGAILDVPIYQYVAVQKSQLPLIDSIETPHTALPLFDPLFVTATFNVNIENGDVVTHAYYTVPVITDAVNPLTAITYTYFQSCLQYTNGTNQCWNGTDFCSYPIVINFGSPNEIVFNNIQEVLAYGEQNIDGNVALNPSNGCFYVTATLNLLNPVVVSQLSQNITTITPPNLDPLIFSVGTQLGTRVFKLATATYTENGSFDYYTATTDYYDFYINYGDDTPIEHHVGIFGVGNPITHTYSVSAPTTVNVTILGLLPGWVNIVMHEAGGGVNAMIKDVLSWGSVSLRQVSFYYESNMIGLSAGGPPSTVQGYLYFFPYAGTPNIWANLNTWDVTNMTNAIGLFYQITTGTLDLRGWTVPNLKYTSYMFFEVTAPVTGGFSDARPVSLTHGNEMFIEYASNEIDVSNYRTPNLISAKGMFKWTSAFPNLNVTYWETQNLQDVETMFMGCNAIKPIFTNWNMQNITSCNYFIQSSNYEAVRGISASADYNQILIDFESKTNSTGLICNWGTGGGFRQPITGIATGAGLTARTNLVNRGWTIVDNTP